MSAKELEVCARQVKRLLRELHGIMDRTPELDENQYIMVTTSMNIFRHDLFAALGKAGIVIPMSGRETAPGDFEAATRNRGRPESRPRKKKAVARPTLRKKQAAPMTFNQEW